MENQRTAAAADAQGRVPIEGRRHARERHPGPEELSDDYAQWLDSWMFNPDDDEQQQQQQEEGTA